MESWIQYSNGGDELWSLALCAMAGNFDQAIMTPHA
jgi:hypothetical protein